MKIAFTKMHGAGNDYIYVNTALYPLPNPSELSVAWSKPHTGIGSDGLVLIGTSNKADFSMRIFNADGSEATMCGNASRCIAKYVYEKGLTKKTAVTLETLSGIKTLNLHITNNKVESVTVDMGMPADIHEVNLSQAAPLSHGIAVNMGNPHLVIFTNNINQLDISTVGPTLEHYPLFPNRVNVEFAQVLKEGTIRMRVWERGSGITMACGTGACATAVAAAFTHRCNNTSNIIMDGGTLNIEWRHNDNHILMTGPAAFVFEGTIEIPNP